MRAMALIAMLFVAACGGGEPERNGAEPKAASLAAGQWELSAEITALELPEGAARIDSPVGSRTTATVCVGSGRPPSEFFSGEGYDCSYDSYYVRNGRLNVTLHCRRDGVAGSLFLLAEGRFEADSVTYERDLRSAARDGGTHIAARVSGRRAGDCPAGGEGGNQSSNTAG